MWHVECGFSRRLDPSLRIPESYQANVGIERELPRAWVFEANYTYNRSLHLWREFNINAPRLPPGFTSFTQYLSTADFPNFLSGPAAIDPSSTLRLPVNCAIRLESTGSGEPKLGDAIFELGVRYRWSTSIRSRRQRRSTRRSRL
jgi:hypothetical protein